MNKIFNFIIGLLFTSVTAISQNQARHWYFGNGVGVSFASGNATLVPNGAITTSMGCSAISNTLGQLLFYTDGSTIFNQNHQTMANGTGLLGSNAFQSSLIIKQPQNQNLYYVFTVGATSSTNGLNYSVVDMNLAAGMGSVTIKNISINPHSRDKLTAGKHCNGDDIWIVSSGGNVSTIVSCLLTSSGIATVVTSPSVGSLMIKGIGEMKLSPNGRKLAISSYSQHIAGNYCDIDFRLYDFDNTNGSITAITNNSQYQSGNTVCSFHCYGNEFSSDSKYFYRSFGTNILSQDLCGSNNGNSAVVPLQENVTTDNDPKRTMQLASDGKIYVALSGAGRIGVINNPSQTGSLPTNYNPNGLSLGTFTCQWGLPNFPGYYFEKKPTPIINHTVSANSCLTTMLSTPPICSNTGYSLTGYQWNFGDTPSGTNNISFLSNPVHTYPAAGNYTVSLIRYFLCNTNDTITEIIHLTQPTLSVLSSTSVCSSITASAQVSAGIGPYSYSWSASSQTNSAATYSVSGMYSITVIDKGAGGCSRTETVNLSVVNLTASIINSSISCFGQNTASASVNVLGGSGNYIYNWGGLSALSIPTLSALSAGIHSFTAIDAIHQCSVTESFTVNQPSPLTLSLTSNTTSLCVGQNEVLTALVSGGMPVYSLFWSNGLSNTHTISITNLQAGSYNYTCFVNDMNNCTNSNTISLIYHNYPLVSSSNKTICSGDTTVLLASGATNYTWMPLGVFGASVNMILTSNSTYTIFGESNGCINSAIVNVSVNALPNIIVSSNSPLCVGQKLMFNSNSFSTYLWTGPLGFASNIQNPTLTNITTNLAGTYFVQVTDTNNCKAATSMQVNVNELPTITISASKQNICLGERVILTAFGAQSYNWEFQNLTTNTIQITPQENNTYKLTGYNELGCNDTSSILIFVSKCLEINETINKTSFKIYPNPSSGTYNIELLHPFFSVQVFDALGKLIIEQNTTNGNLSLDISPHSNGIYFIQIKALTEIWYEKLILEH